MRAIISHYRFELAVSLRNGEQLLVNLAIPLGILLFFSEVDVLGTTSRTSLDELVPSVLALAVMSSSLVSLGVGVGFQRYYGVLKRLGVTPLGRPRWLVAMFATIVTIELIQFIVLIGTGLVLGWNPAAGWPMVIVGTIGGTAAFGGVALLLAGTLPGLTNLAVCNALYLVLLVTGGMIVSVDEMPGPMSAVAKAFPAAPLVDIMIGALSPDHSISAASWIVLGIWAILAPLFASRVFSWD